MATDFVIEFIFERELKKDDLIETIKILQHETGSEVDIVSEGINRNRITNIDEIIPPITNNEDNRIDIWINNREEEMSYGITIYTNSLKSSARIIRFHSEWYYQLFGNGNDSEENVKRILNFFRKVYSTLMPFHGYLATGEDPNNYFVTAHFSSTSSYEKRYEFLLNGINLFGPSIVEHIGRNRLKSLNAYIKEEFNDGGMLIVPVALNDKEYDNKYFRSNDFRIPLESRTVDWYCGVTGLKKELKPRKWFEWFVGGGKD